MHTSQAPNTHLHTYHIFRYSCKSFIPSQSTYLAKACNPSAPEANSSPVCFGLKRTPSGPRQHNEHLKLCTLTYSLTHARTHTPFSSSCCSNFLSLSAEYAQRLTQRVSDFLCRARGGDTRFLAPPLSRQGKRLTQGHKACMLLPLSLSVLESSHILPSALSGRRLVLVLVLVLVVVVLLLESLTKQSLCVLPAAPLDTPAHPPPTSHCKVCVCVNGWVPSSSRAAGFLSATCEERNAAEREVTQGNSGNDAGRYTTALATYAKLLQCQNGALCVECYALLHLLV